MADDQKDDVTTEETPEEVTAEVTPVEEAPAEETVAEEAPAEETVAEEVEAKENEAKENEDYQFDDDLTSSEPAKSTTSEGSQGGSGGGGGGGYAKELFSKTIHAKFRTFYVDLKESSNGKFVKVSEKSRGRKSTIMMDAEDVPAMIEALQEVQKQL